MPGKKKILVIDDDLHLRELMVDFFSMKGFAVVQASDGRKGLEAIRKEKPDLVFLDLIMPNMNGLEVLEQMKGEGKDRPIIIMLSGNQEEDAAREAVRLGAYDYLTKPFSFEKLENEFINRILGS